MPNRILKESANESRGLTSCTFFAQDLYKRLITYADDYGRFNADPQIMIARLYPRELSVVSLDDLIDGLIELAGVEKIKFYTAQPRREIYGCFPNWAEHQRVRDSKKKNPEPQDTSINDWYLRRYVSVTMKAAIIRRDGFKCKQCGKHIAETNDAERLVKMGAGLFHIDHIVPCNQGGRATMENLRLLCPKCNLSRKKTFTYDEILHFAETGENLPRLAETFCELRPESNPIQSNPNPYPNTDSTETSSAQIVAKLPLLDGSEFEITEERFTKDKEAYPAVDVKQEYLQMARWLESNPTRKKTRNGIGRFINSWLEREQNKGGYKVKQGGQEPKKVHAQDYTQRVYKPSDLSAATEALLLEAMEDD